MKKDAAKLLARSEECLEEAIQLFDSQHYLGTVPAKSTRTKKKFFIAKQVLVFLR